MGTEVGVVKALLSLCVSSSLCLSLCLSVSLSLHLSASWSPSLSQLSRSALTYLLKDGAAYSGLGSPTLQ